MSSRKLRVTSLLVVLVGTLAMSGLLAPGASADVGDLQIEIVNQPSDAGVGDLITAEAFDPTGGESGFVQVHVTQTVEVCDPETEICTLEDQDLQFAEVTFVLAEGVGLATSDDLAVETRLTNADGIATFAPEEGSGNPLSIGDANQPLTTAYKLIPVVTPPGEETIPVEGEASAGFDIWEDGCHGTGCNVNLRSNLETYTAQGNFGLAASQLSGELVTCPTQRVIFSNKTFFHVTTGNESQVVRLETHITRADMKAAANNGQKHVGWCIGLESSAPWEHNGAAFTPQTIGAKTFYVAMAPKCPNKKTAPQFAPCVVSQSGDNDGGSFIRGFVLGGDPPRRT
jgi:hypothetical protein